MEVLGAITSVIAIIDTTFKSYRAIKKIRDLPEAFDAVGQQLKSVGRLLKQIQEKGQGNETTAIDKPENEEIRLAVEECKAKAEALEKLFRHLEEKCNKSEESTCVWKDRFKNIYKAFLKGRKADRVESLMAELWKSIERVAVIKIISMGDLVQQNAAGAIEDLNGAEPSLDDSEFDQGGFQATQQIGTGATGTQTNVCGDDNIVNSGNLPGDFAGSRFENFHYGGKYYFVDEIPSLETLRRNFLSKYEVMDYTAHLRNTRRHLDGTCQWFRKHSAFGTWLNSDGGLLLVSADAGCGKSVIAKYLVEQLLSEEAPGSIICYFFFKESDPEARSFLNAVKALLHCLFKSDTAFIDAAMSMNNATLNPDKDLDYGYKNYWKVFETLSRRQNKRRVICVLDALDESDPTDRHSFLECLRDYTLNGVGTCNAKFIITTREYPQIMNLFDQFHSEKIHLDGNNDEERREIQQEISMVMNHRLNELEKTMGGIGPATLQIIRTGLSRNGSGQRTYLWMHLMFDYIHKNRFCSLEDWREIFRNPPDTVDRAYEKLLQSVTPLAKENVRCLLALILAAKRPLDVTELSTAINTRKNTLESRRTNLNDIPEEKEFRSWIRWECGSFISIHDGKVYLIHQTAMEFLLKATETNQGYWQGSMTEHVIHQYMAECCISFLSLDKFRHQDFIKHVQKVTSIKKKYVDEEELVKDLRLEPFTAYSTLHWIDHFRRCQQPSISNYDHTEDIGNKFFDLYLGLFTEVHAGGHIVHGEWTQQPWYLIRMAYEPVEAFTRWDMMADGIGSLTPNCLTVSDFACLFDHRRLLMFALDMLERNSANRANEAAFHSTKTEPVLSLAHFAAYGGSSWCLSHLHYRGYDIDVKDYGGQTPLHKAILKDDAQVITSILNVGASKISRDNLNRTPLTYGLMLSCHWLREYFKSMKQNEPEMRSLLYFSALAEIPEYRGFVNDTIGRRPIEDSRNLPLAPRFESFKQMLVVARFISPMYKLHAWGADLGHLFHNSFTALHLSVQSEKRIYNTVTLIEYRRDLVNAVDDFGNTPLHTATSANNIIAMKMLLDVSKDSIDGKNRRGEGGDTPLHMACRMGNQKAIKVLRDADVDFEIQNNDGYTAAELSLSLGFDFWLPNVNYRRGLGIRPADRWASGAMFADAYESRGNFISPRLF